jgi:Concanavalin A-like lectin/glucanases superfamily
MDSTNCVFPGTRPERSGCSVSTRTVNESHFMKLPISRILCKLLKISALLLLATSTLPSLAQAPLKLHWNLNENTGTVAGDSSGQTPANNGTFPPPVPGGSPIVWGPGYQGSGAYARGVPYTSNGITASNASYQIFSQGSGAFTLAMWIKPPTGPPSWSPTVYPLATNKAGTQGFRLGVDYTYNYNVSDHWEARLKFWSTESGGTVSLLSSTLLTKDAWNQIAVTYDGTTAKMYINAALVGQANGTITNGTETFKVGGGFTPGVFNGTIDEVRVWQGTPDPSEIFRPPKLYWRLNEIMGTEASDSSGNGNVGTFPLPPYSGGVEPVIWGTGLEGNGANFVGSIYPYDGITAPNNANQIFSQGNGAFTLAMWISPASNVPLGTVNPLATNEFASTRGFRLGLYYWYTSSPSYQLLRHLKFWSTDSGGTVSLLSSTSLPVDAWSHIAVTYDGTTAKMYINGMLDGQQNGTITSGTETFKVGGGFNTRTFRGTIDQVRVWQGALDPVDIFLPTIPDATITIPQITGCGAGAVAIPLPIVIGGCDLEFEQLSGPGFGNWVIGWFDGTHTFPNPGFAKFDNPPTDPPTYANIAVAGDYQFSVVAECVNATQQFKRFLRHAQGDAYVNFAMGGVVAATDHVPETNLDWSLQYSTCPQEYGACPSTCSSLSTPIIDFRERVQSGTEFPVTVRNLSSGEVGSLCYVFLRFTVPSNCTVFAHGPAWSPTGDFKVLAVESHSEEGYNYYTLAADTSTVSPNAIVVYQVKIVRQ